MGPSGTTTKHAHACFCAWTHTWIHTPMPHWRLPWPLLQPAAAPPPTAAAATPPHVGGGGHNINCFFYDREHLQSKVRGVRKKEPTLFLVVNCVSSPCPPSCNIGFKGHRFRVCEINSRSRLTEHSAPVGTPQCYTWGFGGGDGPGKWIGSFFRTPRNEISLIHAE